MVAPFWQVSLSSSAHRGQPIVWGALIRAGGSRWAGLASDGMSAHSNKIGGILYCSLSFQGVKEAAVFLSARFMLKSLV